MGNNKSDEPVRPDDFPKVLLPDEDELIVCEPVDPFSDAVPIEYPVIKEMFQPYTNNEMTRWIDDLVAESSFHDLHGLTSIEKAIQVHPDCGHFIIRKAIEWLCRRTIEKHSIELRVMSQSDDSYFESPFREPSLDQMIWACSSIFGDRNARKLVDIKNSVNGFVHGSNNSMWSTACFQSVAENAKSFCHVLKSMRESNNGRNRRTNQ